MAPRSAAALTRDMHRLAAKRPGARLRSLQARKIETLERLADNWPCWAHAGQLPPPGNWRTWLLMAGRGFGKTRAGAEWIGGLARRPSPALEAAGAGGADGPLRIALIGGTENEARAIMIEGRSGLLHTGPPEDRPRYLERRGELIWPSGARAFTYSGMSPEALRGPEHHFAWCDELAKWTRADETWANLMLGLRLGARPRALVTTTPRPTALLRRLSADPMVAQTRGAMADNPALSGAFAAEMRAMWGETRFGRQELDGQLIDDVEGSLWPRALIERCRVGVLSSPGRGGPRSAAEAGGDYERVVVGVDPPASASGDACGIIVVGRREGVGYVLEDASVAGRSPEGWARAVAGAAGRWRADRVVAEVNQGGDMVESVLRAANVALPVRKVHAARGKVARAEPVAALYESGAMKHAGAFPELEDELAGIATGGYAGPGRSPDRADALVWAASELMLKPERARLRISLL